METRQERPQRYKGIPGEEVVSLHHLMVCDLEVKRSRPVQQEKFRPRRKVWKLRVTVARKRFEEVLDIEEGEGVNQIWEKTWDSLLKAQKKFVDGQKVMQGIYKHGGGMKKLGQ